MTINTGDNSTETAGGSEEGFIFKARPKWIDQEPVVVVSFKELIEN